MAQKVKSVVSLLHLCFVLFNLAQDLVVDAKQFNRYDFPQGFVFGASSSAYQVEGAAFEDGWTASIFDTHVQSQNLSINGNVTCDGYHRYKEDVQLMVDTGLDAYHFSISWSRLIPDGRGPINPKGLEFYNNLIDELISHGIQPHATLLHIDIPQALEDDYGGFINRSIIEDITTYADVCFREFGDRVRQWTTVNEANMFTLGGYDFGDAPPNRCSLPFGKVFCAKGNSVTEPYLVAHNILLAHASIAKLYKEKYKAKQRGSVGLSLFAIPFIPYTNTKEDVAAAQRHLDSFVGWFMHPLVYGDYPEILKRNAGTKIPTFTKSESELVKGSSDFIGINYYGPTWVKDNSSSVMMTQRDFYSDMGGTWTFSNDSSSPKIDGWTSENIDPAVASWGMQRVLEHFKEAYDNPLIYIYENGLPINQDVVTVNDPQRVHFMKVLIKSVLDAVRNGSNTKGYFVWSFLDMLELRFGGIITYGLYYVDLVNDPTLTRHPKLSQRWYSRYLKGGDVTIDDEVNQDTNMPTSLRISRLRGDELNLAS